MLTLDATALACIASPVRGVALLVELRFTSGTVYFTPYPIDVPSGGHVYTTLGGLVSIEGLSESENTRSEQITLNFTIVNTAMLAECMQPPTEYRNKYAIISLQLVDAVNQPAGAAVERWRGYMEKFSIERNSNKLAGGGEGKIKLNCTRAGLSRARNDDGLRISHAQQQVAYPGDNGFEYMTTLIEKPQLWVSKRFQQI